MAPVDLVGWCATAVFVGSYFFSKPEVLRRVQMAGALLWMIYGVLLSAPPIIAANLLVMMAAAWTAHRASGRLRAGNAGPPEGGTSAEGDFLPLGGAAPPVRRRRPEPPEEQG